MAAKGKAAGSDQTERVREIVRKLRDERYQGSVTETAKALGVTQPTLSEMLNGKRGFGMQMLEGLRDLTGMPLDEIVYGNQPLRPTDGAGMRGWFDSGLAGALPGWEDAEKQARASYPDVPNWAWDVARTMTSPPAADATPDLAAELAHVAWRYTGPLERARREAEAQAKGLPRLKGAGVRPRRGD